MIGWRGGGEQWHWRAGRIVGRRKRTGAATPKPAAGSGAGSALPVAEHGRKSATSPDQSAGGAAAAAHPRPASARGSTSPAGTSAATPTDLGRAPRTIAAYAGGWRSTCRFVSRVGWRATCPDRPDQGEDRRPATPRFRDELDHSRARLRQRPVPRTRQQHGHSPGRRPGRRPAGPGWGPGCAATAAAGRCLGWPSCWPPAANNRSKPADGLSEIPGRRAALPPPWT